MRIEKRGLRITDLPGVEYIDVKPDEPVTVKFTAMEHPMAFGPTELGQLVEGLQAALTESQFLAGVQSNAPLPRVFVEGDEIPADVTRVVDCDDDSWYRDGDMLWHFKNADRSLANPETTTGMLSLCGPVTEVRT